MSRYIHITLMNENYRPLLQDIHITLMNESCLTANAAPATKKQMLCIPVSSIDSVCCTYSIDSVCCTYSIDSVCCTYSLCSFHSDECVISGHESAMLQKDEYEIHLYILYILYILCILHIHITNMNKSCHPRTQPSYESTRLQ